ncbi:MAG TPA: hypothetical protein VLK82_08550 [Candidatus Tectomicrobia bacterium]|nr:hypothetical protein [Candidatus Tectomicrobia bacterium]
MTVVYKGISGETAEQTLARFTRDVLPNRLADSLADAAVANAFTHSLYTP